MEKRTLELEINTGKSEKDVAQLVGLMSKMIDKLNDIDKKTESIEEIGKGAKKSAGGIKGMLKNLTSVGNLFKASGVFFIAQKIFESLSEAFRNNQVYLDGFNIAGQMATKVIGDFTNFVFNNFGKVSDFFKSVFEDPSSMVDNLVDSIKNNLQVRLNSILDMFGYLGEAASKFFDGDFSGAMDAAKMAGSEFVDTMTGVDDSVNKISEGTKSVTEAVINYGNETFNAAKKTVELNKQAELAEAINQGLIESYDVQAEQQRQIRDDETKSFAVRIAANKELARILEEQQDKMLEQAQKSVEAAKAQLAIDKDNQEAKIALQQAENELAAVKARVTGQASEQLTNENSLIREQRDLMNELSLIGKSEFERQKLEAEQLRDLNKEKILREVEDDALRRELLAANEEEYQQTLTGITTEETEARNAQKQAEIDKENEDAEEKIRLANAVKEAKINDATSTLNQITQLAGEGSEIGKAAAVASATISGIEGVQNAYSTAQKSPITAILPAYPVIQAGLAAAFSAMQIKSILSTPKPRKGGMSATSPSVSSSQAPAFNVVGAAPENQLAQAINGKEEQPVKAYVVSNEVTNAQALERNIVDSASIG